MFDDVLITPEFNQKIYLIVIKKIFSRADREYLKLYLDKTHQKSF